MKGFRATTILLLALVPLAAGAQIYRWVDAQGQVHYTQTPPTNGRYQSVAPAPPPPGDNLSGLKRFVDRNDAQRAKQQAAQAKAAKKRKRRAAACKQAQARLSFLDTHTAHRLARRDAQGNYHRLTQEAFEKQRAQAAARAQRNCGAGSP